MNRNQDSLSSSSALPHSYKTGGKQWSNPPLHNLSLPNGFGDEGALIIHHRAIRIFGNKNEARVSDGMSTFIIHGYFLVGLPILFFPSGGITGLKSHHMVHAFFFLSSTRDLGFGLRVSVPVLYILYHTCMSKKKKDGTMGVGRGSFSESPTYIREMNICKKKLLRCLWQERA